MNPSSFVEVKYCYLSDTDKLQQSEALPLLVQEHSFLISWANHNERKTSAMCNFIIYLTMDPKQICIAD